MDFNANQMRQDALIQEGRYAFSVLDAREKRSTGGNDMLKLKLALNINGRRVIFWDNLMLMPKMFWKIEHFCDTTGMLEKIEQGRLMAQDCMGKEGVLDIVQRANSETGEIENAVKDYVKREAQQQAPVDDIPPSFDDDIPL